MIPIYRAKLPNTIKLIKYFEKIESNQIYSNFGPLSHEVEFRFSEYLEVNKENVVTVANATMAITGLTQLMESQNWTIPNFTFAAVPHAVLNSGKNIYISDIARPKFAIDLERIDEKDGLIYVCPFGAPPPDSNSYNEQGIKNIIIDAAASYDAFRSYQIPHDDNVAYVISLHATKLVSAGEGAVVVSRNAQLINKLRTWTNFGFDPDRNIISVGTNAKLSEYAAAVALASMDQWEDVRSMLIEKESIIRDLSSKIGINHFPFTHNNVTPYWNIEINSDYSLDQIIKIFYDEKILVRSWWGQKCLDEISIFSKSRKAKDLQVSRQVSKRLLGLPFFPDITMDEITKVLNVLKKFL